MKHIVYLCLLLMMVGCSQDETGECKGVRFSADMESGTRATDVSFDAGDQIGVFAKNCGDESLVSNNVRYTYGNGFVAAGVPIYYPEDGNALSFYAVYPYNSSISHEFWFSVAENQSQIKDYDVSNLMIAITDPTVDLIPHLQFKHQMANVLFAVQNEFDGFEVTGVRFYDLALTMHYDMLNDKLLEVNEYGNIVPRVQDGYYMALFPPQSKEKDAAFINVEGVLNGSSIELVLKIPRTTDFKAGFRYEYTLYIDKEGYYSLK